METLAMLGGPRTVPKDVGGGSWPLVTDEDEQAVLRVLQRGTLTSTAAGEPEVSGLEREWADFVGVAHCAAVSSGTAAIRVALQALGIGPGDEVVVPALTMNATAHAVLECGATPVFADIGPDTYNLDPGSARDVLSERTRALLPVHLHGLPADMDELLGVARPRGLPIVEDAAQSHGATYRGRHTGALGTIGCFSLHPSKNLPTCGEGGLITTDSEELHQAAVMLRNFGERPPVRIRTYLAHRPAGNARLSPVQAAFARSQFQRLPVYSKTCEQTVTELLARLEQLPGLQVPQVPSDRTHIWHILRFRIVPTELELGDVHPAAIRTTLHRLLRAEGVPVSQYQVAPLPAHPAFAAPSMTDTDIAAAFPATCAAVDGTFCLQRRHLGPESGPLLMAYADAFEKVWEHLDVLRRMARSTRDILDWRYALREA